MQLNPKKVRKFHRRLALFFSVAALMSSGSGVLHNIMSRTQAPPPAARPAGHLETGLIKVSVSDALKALPDEKIKIQAVSIRGISGEPWYQFLTEGTPGVYYVSAESGRLGSDEDEIYAAEIATNYLGGLSVKKTEYLTHFNGEYINIFRILPVYRFDTGDEKKTRVYVSTMTGSVTRYTDNDKQFEANSFSNFHKLMFIKNKDVRDFILTFMTLGIFVAALSGITLFFLTRKT